MVQQTSFSPQLIQNEVTDGVIALAVVQIHNLSKDTTSCVLAFFVVVSIQEVDSYLILVYSHRGVYFFCLISVSTRVRSVVYHISSHGVPCLDSFLSDTKLLL